MKKTKKTLLTAAVLTSAVSLNSCNWFSEPQDVYGPPVDISESSESSYNPAHDNMQTEYEAPIAYEYETEPEITEEVTTEATTEKILEETTEPDKEYDPSQEDEYLQTDYGCPPVIEPEVDEYDPALEDNVVVYGPPSYFE